jgi:kynurenine formamidase
VYYDGKLYNGFPASSVTSFGATKDSIDRVAERGGVIGRGVFLDVARHLGVDILAPSTAITPAMLDDVVSSQQVDIREGDIVVVRTGWWSQFVATGDPNSWLAASPGLSWTCAEWLHERRIAAVAMDNPAVEVMPPEAGVLLLLHCLAIRDMGMSLGEVWNLEALSRDCQADGVYEFLLVAPVLNVSGAVGTPISPVAVK